MKPKTFTGWAGVELERPVFDREWWNRGEAVMVPIVEWLGKDDVEVPLGVIGTDAGVNHSEIASVPVNSTKALARSLEHIDASMPADWLVLPMPFQWWPVPWSDKPRYDIIRQAIAEEAVEHGRNPRQIERFSQFSATQFTFEIDAETPAGLSVMNYLNHVGPYVFNALCRRYNIKTAHDHMSCWRFGDPRRAPASRWFPSVADLRQYFTDTTALISQNGSIHIDRQQQQQWGNPLHIGTTWWGTRPKPNIGCIEFRTMPAMSVEQVLATYEELRSIVVSYITYSQGTCFSTPQEATEVFRRVYRDHTKVRVPLVPSRPLSEREWEAHFTRTDYRWVR